MENFIFDGKEPKRLHYFCCQIWWAKQLLKLVTLKTELKADKNTHLPNSLFYPDQEQDDDDDDLDDYLPN